MRLPALFVVLTALTPWAAAQRPAATPAHAAAPRPAVARSKAPTGSFAFGRSEHPSRFHRPSPLSSLLFPFLGDSFNPDDIYSTGYPVSSQPPVILLQAARAMGGSADYLDRPENASEPSSSSQPLMIELQNGRYVRVNNSAADGEALPLTPAQNSQSTKLTRHSSTRPPVTNSAPAGPAIAAALTAHNLPPVVLIFRDGHSEEVRDYTIAEGILYARGDYYTDGYWNKKIDLATLDVAQTVQANTTRNVKFALPSSPNEVIIRP
jgi:hypothetical protein